MDNKFLRFCIVEPKCWLRMAVLLLLVAVIIGQSWYSEAQNKKLSALQVKGTLVVRIADMEKELKTKEQLAAFKNAENAALGNDSLTKISGVAMQDGKPSVVIDGTVYMEGDSFGEYVVDAITQEMITLVNKKTNARKHLYVFEEKNF